MDQSKKDSSSHVDEVKVDSPINRLEHDHALVSSASDSDARIESSDVNATEPMELSRDIPDND